MPDLDETLILKQLAVDRAADAVLWLDAEGRLRYVNDAACEDLGYTRDELLAMTIFDVDETLDRSAWAAHWEQIKTLERSTMQTYYLTRTGKRFPVEATVNFISHRGREYHSIFARGISEQKEAEDALIAITARLEALIENLPVGILFEDDQRKVVLANQTLCQLLDIPIPPGSLAGNDSRTLLDQCKDLFPAPQQFLSRVETILDARMLVKNEELGLNDGRVFARDYVPIQTKKYRAHLWQFRDVTERKRAEAELLKAKLEAEKANAAKSSFLAMMSHELRTPLNAVLGMTELSLETELTREQREFLRTIQGNSENLLGLIDDVLDLSRIEANRMDIEHIPYDPRALVEEVAGSLNVRAAAKDVELVVDIDPHLPSQILGDPKRVRQVLVNLIGNAVKFTEKGYVLVSAELEDWKPGDRLDLALSVHDTGLGIPEEKQKDLFSRFYQADRTTTRRFGGSGLGLNISRSLTELMGGRIDFTSAQGEGSTFRVTLTTRAPQDTEPNSTAHRARFSELRARALLSVSTEPLARSLHRTLKAWGFEVDMAETLADLEARVESHSHGNETLLSIVEHFPERVGLSVLKRLREPPGRELVLLTSLAASSSSILAEIAPHVIVKPVRQTKLAEAVAIALGLRARATTEPRVAVPPESSRRLAGYRILLVEDNPDNQLLAARVLETAGAEVETAANGAEAVAMAETEIYDLIVMDLMMPVMDGFQATQAIRAGEDPVNRTPIVALTAHATEGFRKKCLETGMDGYLSKPFKKERLLALVEQWVDRRPLLLVVDDAPENRLIVRRFLTESENYRMIFAANGREALELFEKHLVSLILLDMEMPVVDGFETARSLRQLEGAESTPILAMTAHAEPSALKHCLEAGCTAVLQKPLARQELNAAVARHLGPSEPSRPQAPVVAESAAGLEGDPEGNGDSDKPREPADGVRVVVVDPDILDLVPRFIEAQRSNTGRILELARAGEFETVRRLGHNMKGTGKGYGFEIISSYGASLESAAQRSAETDIERIVSELGDYLSSVRWQARR